MKILHVIPALSPIYGGPTTNLIPLCEAQRSLGHQVEIAATNANGLGDTLKKEDINTDLNIHLFKRSFSEAWKFSFEFKSWIEENITNFDLICLHAVWSFLPFYAGKIAIKNSKPFVVRPAGMLSPYTFSRKSILKKFFWQFFDGPVLKKCSGFHATSSSEKEEVLKLCPGAQVGVFPHGLQEEAFTVTKNTNFLRFHLGIKDNLPIILFLSRIHPKKGILDILLPAYQKLVRRAHLVFVGGPDPHEPFFFNQVKKLIESKTFGSCVHFFGPIRPEDRWFAYDSADVFVLPSQSENFGVVVIEAMARGIPVIVSDGVQIHDIVLKNQAGWVIPRQVQAWTSAIDFSLSVPYNNVSRYSVKWVDVAKSLDDFYFSILANPFHKTI